jgi:hypothetical protein
LDDLSLQTLGRWLSRKWHSCQKKLCEARAELGKHSLSEDTLRTQWTEQVHEQTKPIPRMFSFIQIVFIQSQFLWPGRSHNKGKQAIEVILTLGKTLDNYNAAIDNLEALLLDDAQNTIDTVDVDTQLHEYRLKVVKVTKTLQRKKAALGIEDQQNLSRLKQNEYLRVRMNALALKKRIRDRLRNRKFELERLERSYRHTLNSVSKQFEPVFQPLTLFLLTTL